MFKNFDARMTKLVQALNETRARISVRLSLGECPEDCRIDIEEMQNTYAAIHLLCEPLMERANGINVISENFVEFIKIMTTGTEDINENVSDESR